MNSDGISRLISLFANSGGGGCAEKTTRKNAAICLAKLARDGEIKEVRVITIPTVNCNHSRRTAEEVYVKITELLQMIQFKVDWWEDGFAPTARFPR